MLRASIDLGTNTCLLLIAEWDPARREVTRVIEDHSTVVRLGQGVDKNRELHPEAKARTLACLESYAARVKAAGVSVADAVCVATSQARDSKNGADFFQEIEATTGFRFRVISGNDEASYTFQGALLPGLKAEDCAVIDIGGGSTEITDRNGGHSLDIGSVRFTERFLKSDPVTDDEFWVCQDAIDDEVRKLLPWRESVKQDVQLLAVAGTATTLAAWYLGLQKFDATRIDEVTLTRGDIHRMVEELKWRTVAERMQLTGIERGRADVILAGAMILWRTMELLNFPSTRVSTRGLRFGVFNM